jgi:NADP-dependent 3-hydroxy acid dehydrogenase YdfG
VNAPIAIVTGANSEIGAATARRLAAEGFSVVVCARRRDRLGRLAQEIGGRAATLDVTDAVSVAALADSVPECAVLINNAGGALGRATIAEADERQWQRMYETNVLGTVRVTKALLPALLASDGGHVVIVTSISAREVYEGGAGYLAAKHAQAAVAETLRLEFLGQPVWVSEIAKGIEPVRPEDIAECIAWMVSRPPNVDVSFLSVTPLAQATNNAVHRATD